jgi:hypothetical protein
VRRIRYGVATSLDGYSVGPNLRGIRHRFEVYDGRSETVYYLHQLWPQAADAPLWIGLFCWAAAAFLGAIVYRRWSSTQAAQSVKPVP